MSWGNDPCRVPTLPTLLALRSTDSGSERLRALLAKPLTDDDELAEAITLLRAHPAMDEARAYVRAETDAAQALLAKLPESSAREALQTLCTTVATRLG